MCGKERDTIEIYRLQGEIRVLELLNTLPVVVSDYLKKVSTGEFKKIVDPLQFNPRKELENVR
jgi:DNA-binding cell septation regulator SpoVG